MSNDTSNTEKMFLIVFGVLGAVLAYAGEWGLAFLMIIIGATIVWAISKSKKKSPSNSDTPTYDKIPLINKESNTETVTITDEDFQNNLSRFDWRMMEKITEALFEKKGYEAEATQATVDGGIDVEARNNSEYIGIQVKHQIQNVGSEAVAKTLGSSSKFNRFIVISARSGFTAQAIKRAEEDPYKIELWNSEKFKEELQQFSTNN